MRHPARRALDSGRCGVGWGLLVVNTAVLGPVVAAVAGVDEGGELGYRVGQAWTRNNLRILGVTWEIRGTDSGYADIPHMTRLEYCSSISTQQNGREP